MINIPILLTLYAGFTHAFETDHLLAVSNMVTNRSRLQKAMKDGIFWGLGHTSTILIVGCIFLIIKFQIEAVWFSCFEAAVGFMLIFLGLYRFLKWYKNKPPVFAHYHDGKFHSHTSEIQSHLPSYFIGLVHGLAGSGALMLIVLSKANSTLSSLLYLVLFGIGSIAGMMLAAALFSLPFTKKYLQHTTIQGLLIMISSALCIVYGLFVVKENLFT